MSLGFKDVSVILVHELRTLMACIRTDVMSGGRSVMLTIKTGLKLSQSDWQATHSTTSANFGLDVTNEICLYPSPHQRVSLRR